LEDDRGEGKEGKEGKEKNTEKEQNPATTRRNLYGSSRQNYAMVGLQLLAHAGDFRERISNLLSLVKTHRTPANGQ
jgi:hypothetical protein